MTVVNRAMYPLQTSMNLIAKMQDQFSDLQTQLSTGQKASTLSGLGTDRFFDLSIHARQECASRPSSRRSYHRMLLRVSDARLDRRRRRAHGRCHRRSSR